MEITTTTLGDIANEVLLANTRKLVGRTNQTLAVLLAHLGEVEARGLHDVLERAKHRTKKELLKLIRELDPLPDVPARVEPLSPAAGGFTVPRAPTWGEWWTSLERVRDLEPGDRPRDWTEPDGDTLGDTIDDADHEPAPARVDSRDDKPQRYKVQFTATDAYVALLERAKDLLSHTGTDRSLETVHLRALQALVVELEKRRFGVGAKQRSTSTKRAGVPRQRGAGAHATPHAKPDVKPSRHIPLAVRREVWERDGGRCAYVDERGQRCPGTALLELHHEQAFALGGPPTAANISLRCRCHNRLAAEHDFGRDFIDRKIGPRRRTRDPQPAIGCPTCTATRRTATLHRRSDRGAWRLGTPAHGAPRGTETLDSNGMPIGFIDIRMDAGPARNPAPASGAPRVVWDTGSEEQNMGSSGRAGVAVALIVALAGCSSGSSSGGSGGSGGNGGTGDTGGNAGAAPYDTNEVACDPLAAPAVALGAVIGAGQDPAGTLYVDASSGVFVSATGKLVRQHVIGTGQSGQNEFLFSFVAPGADYSTARNLLVETQSGTADKMALGPADSKAFLNESPPGITPLALVDPSSLAGMELVNTPSVIVYVADVANGNVLLTTEPINDADWDPATGGLSLFYGPPGAVAQRKITAFSQSMSNNGSLTFLVGTTPYVLVFGMITDPDAGPDAGPFGTFTLESLTPQGGAPLGVTLRSPTPIALPAGLSFTCFAGG